MLSTQPFIALVSSHIKWNIPPTNKWVIKIWTSHMTEYYSAIRRGEVLTLAQHWRAIRECAKWKKPGTTDCVLHGSIYVQSTDQLSTFPHICVVCLRPCPGSLNLAPPSSETTYPCKHIKTQELTPSQEFTCTHYGTASSRLNLWSYLQELKFHLNKTCFSFNSDWFLNFSCISREPGGPRLC